MLTSAYEWFETFLTVRAYRNQHFNPVRSSLSDSILFHPAFAEPLQIKPECPLRLSTKRLTPPDYIIHPCILPFGPAMGCSNPSPIEFSTPRSIKADYSCSQLQYCSVTPSIMRKSLVSSPLLLIMSAVLPKLPFQVIPVYGDTPLMI